MTASHMLLTVIFAMTAQVSWASRDVVSGAMESQTNSKSAQFNACGELSKLGASLASHRPSSDELKQADDLGKQCGARVSDGCRAAAHTWEATAPESTPVDIQKCGRNVSCLLTDMASCLACFSWAPDKKALFCRSFGPIDSWQLGKGRG